MIKGIAYKGKIHNLTDTTSSKAIIDLVWPVGSVYVSMDPDFDPATTWGGVWEVIKEGIFLEATEDNTKVGTEIEAGAPNITGEFSQSGTNYSAATCDVSGAFKVRSTRASSIGNGVYNSGCYIGIDASRSSKVYGKSDTIQPHAIKCKFHRRIG